MYQVGAVATCCMAVQLWASVRDLSEDTLPAVPPVRDWRQPVWLETTGVTGDNTRSNTSNMMQDILTCEGLCHCRVEGLYFAVDKELWVGTSCVILSCCYVWCWKRLCCLLESNAMSPYQITKQLLAIGYCTIPAHHHHYLGPNYQNRLCWRLTSLTRHTFSHW